MITKEYLQEHTLDPAFVKSLGWQWTDETITIPYYNSEGKLLFCKYRNMTTPKFSFDKGSSPALYASHKIKNQQVVIFCEGEPDCARLWQEGIPAVTSGSVTSLTLEIALPLKDKDVIVLMDTDRAGEEAIKKISEILESVGAFVRVGTLPTDTKDVCEYFSQGATKKDITTLINESVTLREWEEQNEPEEYTIITGSEILQREIPKQKWLISKMIPVEGLSFLVGSEGTGKSFYALTMANAIATGEKWLNTFEVKQQTKVLFLDKENTINGIQERLAGLNIKGDALFFLEYPERFIFEGEEKDGLSSFAHYVKQFVENNNIGFIIIDSFIDFMTGNENSSGDTQVFFSAIKQLFPNKSILTIHHAGKPSQGVTRTSSQKTRGSSNIMAQAFSSFFIEQIPRSTIEFSIEHTKLRGAQKAKKFKVEMEIHVDPYDTENTRVTNLKYAGEIEDEELKRDLAKDTIIESLEKTTEILKKDLQEICLAKGIYERTFNRAIKEMETEQIVTLFTKPGRGVSKWISLI